MAHDIDKRLADLKSELASQNERWEEARRALARLGSEPLAVPREFVQQMDALVRVPRKADGGIRG